MKENDYLNPDSIRSQCDAAITKLLKDNAETYTVEKSLNTFVGNGQIASTAFQALKQQISDYKTVLQAMRTANQSDMEDFLTLKLRVGNQELNGAVILEQKKNALKAKKSDEKNAENYRKKARAEKTLSLQMYYTSKVASYQAMAEADQKIYNAWQEKENRYNEIEGCTNGLFTNGVAMRAAAENALNSIRGAFQNGAYVPDMNAAWRGEISSCYINRVMTRNPDGTVKVNWTEVKKILKKDAEQITEEEYNALALLYLNMGEEDMADFLKLCMDKKEDVDFSWWYGSGGALTNGYSEVDNTDYSVWEVNDDKIQKILERLIDTSDETLFMMQMVDSETALYKELKNQRNIIIQRLSLLETMKEIYEYRGEYQAEYPRIMIESNNAEDLILKFCQSRSMNEFCTAMSNLGESTITFSRTKNGAIISWEDIENKELSFEGHIGNFSDYNVIDASEYIVEQIPSAMMGNVIGYVPVIGNVLSFIGDSTVGYVEEVNNALFIRGQVEVLEKINIYRDFDCSANFVYYNTDSSQETVIYVQSGENTAEILKRVNEKMNLTGTENAITMEQVITEPNEVRKIINEVMKKDPDYEDRYDEAIQNK